MYDADTFYTSSALQEKRQILVSLSSGLCIQRDNTQHLRPPVNFISNKFNFTSRSYNLKAIQAVL